ncbi:MAG: hypothetical protein HKN07_08105 [Acidimicrobiia bacterium]|nr:hypothetical protein [Acidimicrobiia bacterium]
MTWRGVDRRISRGRQPERLILAAIGVVVAAGSAHAGVHLVSQSRFVHSEASIFGSGGQSDADSVFADVVDFGPFDATVTAIAEVRSGSVVGTATQRSTLLPSVITAEASVIALANGDRALDSGTGSAVSSLDLIFEIEHRIAFDLTATVPAVVIDAGSASDTFACFTLVGPAGFLVTARADASGGGHDIALSGFLEPGVYTLTALATTAATAGSGTDSFGSAGFDLTLTIPTPTAWGLLIPWSLTRIRRRRTETSLRRRAADGSRHERVARGRLELGQPRQHALSVR